jgi:hypothetical protein
MVSPAQQETKEQASRKPVFHNSMAYALMLIPPSDQSVWMHLNERRLFLVNQVQPL